MLNEDYRDMLHVLSDEEKGGGKDVERTGEKLCKASVFDYAKVLIILNNVPTFPLIRCFYKAYSNFGRGWPRVL